jgi:hypothetical protein
VPRSRGAHIRFLIIRLTEGFEFEDFFAVEDIVVKDLTGGRTALPEKLPH